MSFEQALKENPICILKCENIIVNNDKCKFRIDKINQRVPMRFSKINATIHRNFSDLEYIDFWNGVEIIS